MRKWLYQKPYQKNKNQFVKQLYFSDMINRQIFLGIPPPKVPNSSNDTPSVPSYADQHFPSRRLLLGKIILPSNPLVAEKIHRYISRVLEVLWVCFTRIPGKWRQDERFDERCATRCFWDKPRGRNSIIASPLLQQEPIGVRFMSANDEVCLFGTFGISALKRFRDLERFLGRKVGRKSILGWIVNAVYTQEIDYKTIWMKLFFVALSDFHNYSHANQFVSGN